MTRPLRNALLLLTLTLPMLLAALGLAAARRRQAAVPAGAEALQTWEGEGGALPVARGRSAGR